jgi:hypothetical protein
LSPQKFMRAIEDLFEEFKFTKAMEDLLDESQ